MEDFLSGLHHRSGWPIHLQGHLRLPQQMSIASRLAFHFDKDWKPLWCRQETGSRSVISFTEDQLRFTKKNARSVPSSHFLPWWSPYEFLKTLRTAIEMFRGANFISDSSASAWCSQMWPADFKQWLMTTDSSKDCAWWCSGAHLLDCPTNLLMATFCSASCRYWFHFYS